MGIYGIAWDNMEYNGFKWEYKTPQAHFLWIFWELRFSTRPGIHAPEYGGFHYAAKLLSRQPEQLQADIRAMSIWARIGDLISDSANAVGTALTGIRDAIQSITNPEARRQVAFTIAIIALSAKMAKADGVVTPDEVKAFRQIFTIPPGEETNVARIYNLAKNDIAGFEVYARNVAGLFPGNRLLLEDILDGLFHIAKADGIVHERELTYLETVAGIFGFGEIEFSKLCERHIVAGEGDPYLVLGADRNWDFETLKRHYRKMIAENHPDRLQARGVPAEFIRIATERVAAINAAWDVIESQRDKS